MCSCSCYLRQPWRERNIISPFPLTHMWESRLWFYVGTRFCCIVQRKSVSSLSDRVTFKQKQQRHRTVRTTAAVKSQWSSGAACSVSSVTVSNLQVRFCIGGFTVRRRSTSAEGREYSDGFTLELRSARFDSESTFYILWMVESLLCDDRKLNWRNTSVHFLLGLQLWSIIYSWVLDGWLCACKCTQCFAVHDETAG